MYKVMEICKLNNHRSSHGNKGCEVSTVGMVAPNEATKDAFYEELLDTLDKINKGQKSFHWTTSMPEQGKKKELYGSWPV